MSLFSHLGVGGFIASFSLSLRDDLARAIKKLRILGAGFAVIPMKGGRLVQSVPGELNMDHTAVLQKAEVGERREERGVRGLLSSPYTGVCEYQC